MGWQARCSVLEFPCQAISLKARPATDGEFYHFLGIACGSAAELYTQTMIACELGYITRAQSDKITGELDHIMNRIFKLQDQLQTKHKRRPARS